MGARFEEVELTNMCMVTDGENVLVQDRSDPNWGGLVFPGGHVEKGESIRDSVIREVCEETGITVSDPKLCGIKQFTNGEGRRYLVFLYRATRFSGTLRSSAEGGALWMKMEDVLRGRTVPGFDDLYRGFTDDNVSEIFYPSDGDVEFL